MAAIILSEDSPLAPVYAGLAAVVAASRIHVRIHHASDVLGGAAVGLALGVAVRRLWPRP
jgi:undecaprenyl-diphosphatase